MVEMVEMVVTGRRRRQPVVRASGSELVIVDWRCVLGVSCWLLGVGQGNITEGGGRSEDGDGGSPSLVVGC